MKVNLLLNTDGIRSGHLNIDPFTPLNHPDKTRGDVANLDELVDDAEADELIAMDVIDFLPAKSLESTLTNWIKKIRHGGYIVVGGVDMMAVARGLSRQEIDVQEANKLLYGNQSEPWEYRKSTLTMQTLLNVFQENGFKIIQKRMANYKYLIKAERP